MLNEHWRDWKVHNGKLVDPEGNATTQSQLRGYYMILQYAAHLASRDPEAQAQYWAMLQTS